MPVIRLILFFFLLWPVIVFAGEVTIGAEDDAAPWSYLDGSGYVNDVVRAAYKAVNWSLKIRVFPYARCKRMTEEGKLVACFTASRTPDTEVKLQFPEFPVIVARNLLLARLDSTLKGCDVQTWGRQVSVAFVNEYEYLPVVESLQRSKLVTVQKVNSEVLALRMLEAAHVDAAVLTLDAVKRIDLLTTLAKVKPEFKVICDFGGLPAYVAFSRIHPQAVAALDAFNQGMRIIEKDGTIVHLQRQWASRALVGAAAKNH